MAASASSVLTISLTFLIETALLIYLVYSVRQIKKLRNQNRIMRAEREVIFEFVHNIGEVFAAADDIQTDELIKRILFFATKTGKASGGAIYLFDADKSRLFARAVSGIFPPLYDADQVSSRNVLARSQQLESLVKTRPVGIGEGLIGSIAAVGSGMIIPDAEIDARVPAYSDPFLQIRSLLMVPMRFGNEVLGVIALSNRTDGIPFSQGDLGLLQAMADQASVPVHYAGLRAALEHKRQIDRDLQAAQQIQKSLLPQQLPQIDHVDVAAYNLPAFDIGGDYYDFIRIDDEHLGIAIADVAGKGIGGAMMMAVCQGVLRTRAAQEQSPARMLSELNRVLSENLAEDMFITMLYMILNTRSRELKFARAGHERLLLKKSGNGTPVPIDAKGIAIGLTEADIFDRSIQDKSVSLQPGDIIIAYTDGITEALNPENEEWGTDHLMSVITQDPGTSCDELIGTIRHQLARHIGAQPQYDDMTLLALKSS